MSEHELLMEVIDELRALRGDQTKLTERVEMYLSKQPAPVKRGVVKVSDIAKLKGTTPANLRYVRPWLLPQNGVSQYSGRPARWDVEKYIEWEKTPEDVRRTAYLNNR